MIPTISLKPKNGEISGTWVTSFSQLMTGTSSAWNGYTLRTVILENSLSNSGSKVRLTLKAGSLAEGCSIDACYAGHAASSGDPYDFDGSQVQVTVGGNTSFLIPAGQSVVTDEIPVALDETRAFIVGAHFNNSSNDDVGGVISTGFVNHYYKAAVNEAGSTNVSGYSSGIAANRLVTKIEVFQES